MLPARTLTFDFERVVSTANGEAEIWEVILLPLASPLDGTVPDHTLVGGPRTQDVVLSDDHNIVTFQVVPSDAPGLAHQVWYRVGWRPKFFGRITTFDFTMPDADVAFDDLQNLGAVLGPEVYLRQSDLGTHVAPIDDDGYVLDGNGDRVIGGDSGAMAAVHQERLDRQTADNSLRNNLESQIGSQVAATLTTATARINAAVSLLDEADLAEKGQRIAAVNSLNTAIATVESELNAELTTLLGQVGGLDTQMSTKADLVGGKVATDQLPTLSLTTAVAVAGEMAMLNLTSSQVQPGDLAVRPDGTWLLLNTPPSVLGNWIKLSAPGGVQSINGQQGNVVLSAANVGAIAIGAMIDPSQVSGLVAALASKADTVTVSGINTRLTTVESDTTIVRTVSGLIAKALMPADAVFVDGSNLLRKKDGTLIPGQGGSGGPVAWEQVLDKPAFLAAGDSAEEARTEIGAVADADPRLSDARTPTAHAASHAPGGGDEVVVGQGQVSGLTAALTNHGNRISSLETRTDALESGAPGGGGGASAKALWFDGPETLGVDFPDFADFQTALILQKGPFGQADDGTYYYKPTGADNDEWRYPYITPNGHLELRKWDETAPLDPELATQDDLDTVSTAVALKADTSALTALAGTISTLALQSAVDALATEVDTKADTSALTTLAGIVGDKADAADLTALTTVVTDLSAEVDDLPTAAEIIDGLSPVLSTMQADIDSKEPALPNGGTTSQYLRGDKTWRALDKAAVGLTNVSNLAPADLPLSTAASAALAGKADLIAGKLPTSQLPALAISDTYVVANRAAMLALTPTQAQPGDVCIITATIDKGSYILTASDPSVFSSWTLMSTPNGAVLSVNGQTDVVVLSAADVNARSASASVPLAEVSGLVAALGNKVDTSTYTTGLAGKTSPGDVANIMGNATQVKQRARLASTSPVASLAGLQSVDGTLTAAGDIVLLTAQTASSNNGLWVVSAGSWTRPADMVTGSYFLRGILVTITSGSAANQLWQQVANTGVVDTNNQSWIFYLQAGPPLVYTAAANSGLNLTGTALSVKNSTGISVTSAGVGVDRNVIPMIYKGDVPSGSTTATITHGLGTTDIAAVTVMDKASGIAVLVGWQATGANTIQIEFATAPAGGQWRVICLA